LAIKDIKSEPIDDETSGENPIKVVVKDEVEISEVTKVEVEWGEGTSTTEQAQEMEVIAAGMEEENSGGEVEGSVGPIPQSSDLYSLENKSQENDHPPSIKEQKEYAEATQLRVAGSRVSINVFVSMSL